jgi:hypothetical protein
MAAMAASAIDMVRFFFISLRMTLFVLKKAYKGTQLFQNILKKFGERQEGPEALT